MIDIHPTKCNICGGKVIYTSNAEVYGSGYCYLCTNCGAYVGTHKPRPKDALGLLDDERMREGKKCCHALFDPLWQNKPKAREERRKAYKWLADKMGIDPKDCHFGYFDLEQLKKAYRILAEEVNQLRSEF